jgi:hypothetical protein
MRPSLGMQVRVVTGGLVFALMFQPFAYSQQPIPPQVAASQAQTEEPAAPRADDATAGMVQAYGDQLPDSPGTVRSKPGPPQPVTPHSTSTDNDRLSETQPSVPEQTPSRSDLPNTSAAESPPASSLSSGQSPEGPRLVQPASTQTSEQPSMQAQPQEQLPHEPLGTAAAESIETTGVAASRPAGAAVAPAKQRRVRSILIKVGALVGAGVAIGATMALSQSSPSRPPGSH